VSVVADKEVKWHPIACMFPMLPHEDLLKLSDDVRKNGQHEPIVLFDGMVLDGRNRWQACKIANVEPKVKEFYGSKADALEFVWSTNVHRRHLNSGQIAIALAEREKFDDEFKESVNVLKKVAASKKGGDRKSEWQKIATKNQTEKDANRSDAKLAESVGTNRTYVAKSREIVNKAPELAEKVKAGSMTLSQASTELRREEKRKDLEVKAAQVSTLVAEQPLWTLINQDVMQGLDSIVEHHGPARLIFTDPPYNIGIDYGDHHDDKMTDEGFTCWCLQWMRKCCDCLTDDGSLWVMINDEYAADFVMNLRNCGLTMRAWIKWYETFGVNCKSNFNRTSRHILYFVMDEDNFVFNETEALRPSDRQLKYGDSRAQGSGKILDDVWQIPRIPGTSKERIPDVPTQLPVDLVSQIVRVASMPGDLVVDPFNGSGTTGVACIQSKRKYVGIDASERFIDIADKRLKGVQYAV
jgi:DNA modification methylase